MKIRAYAAALAILLCVLVFAVNTQAQDRGRRVSPSYPIGAGEQMLVIRQDRTFLSGNASQTQTATLSLPVGTVIKRILVVYADTNTTPGVDMTSTLIRSQIADAFTTEVSMRSVNSSGISSSSLTDTVEKISNPISHAMLQGWTYKVLTTIPGTQGSDELSVVAVKVLYEPAP